MFQLGQLPNKSNFWIEANNINFVHNFVLTLMNWFLTKCRTLIKEKSSMNELKHQSCGRPLEFSSLDIYEHQFLDPIGSLVSSV